MLITTVDSRTHAEMGAAHTPHAPDVFQASVRLPEHAWLVTLYKEPSNRQPRFRLADLLGGCVSFVHAQPDLVTLVRAYLLEQVVSTSKHANRRCDIFSAQYAQLLELHRSRWNTQPNPMFEVDLIATACVAVVSRVDRPYERLLASARANFLARSGPLREAH